MVLFAIMVLCATVLGKLAEIIINSMLPDTIIFKKIHGEI
jgi:hypothetical protein